MCTCLPNEYHDFIGPCPLVSNVFIIMKTW
jgi:hypothetical protein